MVLDQINRPPVRGGREVFSVSFDDEMMRSFFMMRLQNRVIVFVLIFLCAISVNTVRAADRVPSEVSFV